MLTAPTLNPGSMDRRIALRYPVEARGGDGSSQPAYTAAATVWAQWLSQNSRAFHAAQARHAELSGVLRIRWRADVMATWRVALDSITYRLAGDPVEVGRREYLDLPVAVIDRPAWLLDENGKRMTDEAGQYLTT